jgi:hypothetical protein
MTARDELQNKTFAEPLEARRQDELIELNRQS